MLAMKEVMVAAGVDTDASRLYTIGQDYLALAEKLGVDALAHLASIRRDMQGKRGEGLELRADKATPSLPSAPPTNGKLGEGQKLAADVGRLFVANAEPTKGDGGGQTLSADKAKSLLPAPPPSYREQSAIDRRMALVVNAAAAQSVLDTFKLRDEPIGRMSWGRMCSIETVNLREAAVIARIRAKVANPEQHKAVGEYITAADLAQILTETNSHAA